MKSMCCKFALTLFSIFSSFAHANPYEIGGKFELKILESADAAAFASAFPDFKANEKRTDTWGCRLDESANYLPGCPVFGDEKSSYQEIGEKFMTEFFPVYGKLFGISPATQLLLTTKLTQKRLRSESVLNITWHQANRFDQTIGTFQITLDDGKLIYMTNYLVPYAPEEDQVGPESVDKQAVFDAIQRTFEKIGMRILEVHQIENTVNFVHPVLFYPDMKSEGVVVTEPMQSKMVKHGWLIPLPKGLTPGKMRQTLRVTVTAEKVAFEGNGFVVFLDQELMEVYGLISPNWSE